ncbi:MAG: DNA-binding protein [Caldithrix sp. RBG_13_44_9]|jgi:DNA-binding protein HU-beta|nr:MAG: DNA-binding protein [Caldithrix sp. RBG_13_44_9]
MNRKDLVDAIASKTKKSRKESDAFLNAFLNSVRGELKKGGQVSLVGFGSFKVVHRPARMARNPRTGAQIKIAARKAPVFRAGKGLKDMF